MRDEVIPANTMLGEIIPQMHMLFNSLLNEINLTHQQHDLVRIFITHDEVVATNIIIGPDYLEYITSDMIIDRIADVVHSNNFIPANKGLSINVTAIRNIAGLNRTSVTNVWRDLVQKNCIISINNEDELCLPRSVAVAIARNDHLSRPLDRDLKRKYDTMRRSERKRKHRFRAATLQRETALRYMRMAGIPGHRVGLISDLPLYEKALQVGITLVSARSGNKKVHCSNKEYASQIVLYHVEDEKGTGHFSVLTRMNALLGRSYYCDECDKGYNNNDRHRCRYWCDICGHSDCPELFESALQCDVCNAPCRSVDCLDRHRAKKGPKVPSKCDLMYFSPDCKVSLRQMKRKRDVRNHICGESYCRNCQTYYLGDQHLCYMRSTSADSKQQAHMAGGKAEDESDVALDEGAGPPSSCERLPKRFIFYDFESMLLDSGEHMPNLVVAQSVCQRCGSEGPVTETSVCASCGSRCNLCCGWNDRRDNFDGPPCKGCGLREMVFSGRGTVTDFCQWLVSAQHRGVTALAHNARSYDNFFIYRYLIRNSIKPEIIFRGAKIMFLHIGRQLDIRLVDSLNFLTMPLSELPRSFGLDEMKKGFFPHLYNTVETEADSEMWVLPTLPPAHYYDADSMKEDRRTEFLTWYGENRDKAFDFHRDLLAYCRSDVDILLNACWKFRTLVMTITGPQHPVDPFNYITIASLCMGIYRSKFLPEKWQALLRQNAIPGCGHEWECACRWTEARKLHGDAPVQVLTGKGEWRRADSVCEKFVSSPLGVLPPHGYARRDNYSKQSLQWIYWFEHQYRMRPGQADLSVRHARSPLGEAEVVYALKGTVRLKYRLDGYFQGPDGSEHAMEFNGCWYHGCPRCYPRDRAKLVIGDKNLSTRHRDMLRKEERLAEIGFVVHSVWSCDFERELAKDGEMRAFVDALDIVEPIDMRDGYFGGRTGAITLYKSFAPPEMGAYLDFCSLYPDVLKYQKFAVGHPKRIVEGFASPHLAACDGVCYFHPCSGQHLRLPYFGVMKVKILPPRRLLFPILPYRTCGKLMFPLCRLCVDSQSQQRCQCTDEERSMTQSWCTPEIEVALNCGYKILKVYEVLHWSEYQMMDVDAGSGGLFSEYIDTFLRIKAQASGYPADVQTEEDRRAYISAYEEHEGIKLDPAEIERNPGLRSIAKLALNSFYGKFGQRVNMKKCAFVTKAKDIYHFLTDYSKKICDFHLVGEDMVAMEYTATNEFRRADRKANVMVASLCTAYARLKLWTVMNRLGQRVLYHDTDSVIYSNVPGQFNPPTGKYLGELADELSCKAVGCPGCCTGHWIQEFVSCGAKNYAFKLNSGQVVCKVRGFSLNFSASKVVNLESMKQALTCWRSNAEAPELITVKTMILRKKLEGVVYSRKVAKHYGIVFNKRVLLDGYATVPYGY